MKNIWLFFFGAFGYGLAELLWRGYTHWAMGIAGGICLAVLYNVNKRENMGAIKSCVITCVLITIVELFFGIIFNIILNMKIWDYSNMPVNFLGQICLPYSLLWYAAGFPIYYICRAIKKHWIGKRMHKTA